MHRILNAAVLTVASLIGLGSFVYPFFVPQQAEAFGAMAHAHDAPLIFVILVVLCLGAVLSSLSSGMMNAKLIAVLGILTAANAVLRGVPGPAGFTLVFLLPILCGYAFGPTFGFLLGVFSLAVSAFLGFGVGAFCQHHAAQRKEGKADAPRIAHLSGERKAHLSPLSCVRVLAQVHLDQAQILDHKETSRTHLLPEL